MSRWEKIEEMVKEIKPVFAMYREMDDYPDAEDIAKALYNAGYRKQSEGEWIDKHCSNCGEELLFERGGNAFATTFRQYKTKYCHNCGAKMKGGAE